MQIFYVTLGHTNLLKLSQLRGYSFWWDNVSFARLRYLTLSLPGLYYPPDSLKSRLCLRGRDLIYERCQKYGIPYRNIGKLVVANEHQRTFIENLHIKASKLQWPKYSPTHNAKVLSTALISGDHAHELEPDLSENIVAALWVPQTGILDSHSLMESLEKDIIESENGELVYSTSVVRVDAYKPLTRSTHLPAIAAEHGWVVQIVTGDAVEGESDAVFARTLINATGLNGPLILNSLLPEGKRITMYYARGAYASYNGPGVSRISRLIYPCPNMTKKSYSFQSLGTHLTLDIEGNVRFGPDLEWIAPSLKKECSEESHIDFWEKHLQPDESRLEDMHKAVAEYLPHVTLEGLQPDFVGIRPKLVSSQGGFQDFVIRIDYSSSFLGTSDRRGPMISLLGIESPGLTSSLAIAEAVVEDISSIHAQEG
jgi:2-hydroxyglutarate dehydrogenase